MLEFPRLPKASLFIFCLLIGLLWNRMKILRMDAIEIQLANITFIRILK